MCNNKHYATLSVFISVRATRLISQNFSLRDSFIFLAIYMEIMLTPPLCTEAGSRLPCVLNLTGGNPAGSLSRRKP
jgi:hypothetical protein